jgi:acetyltransferase
LVEPVDGSTTDVTLDDGTSVTIRPIRRDDDIAVREALRTADPNDLHQRFMGCAPTVMLVLNYFHRADGLRDLAIGAFTAEGRLVGVAQFDRPEGGPTAEFAIEVAHDFQRRGLGARLLADLEDRAREAGVRELTATYYADNFAIRRLLGRSGQLQSSSYECGEGSALLNLRPAHGPASVKPALAAVCAIEVDA